MPVKTINIFNLIDEVAKNTQLLSRNCFLPSNDVLLSTAQNMHLIPPTVEALKPLKVSLNMWVQKKKLLSVATVPWITN